MTMTLPIAITRLGREIADAHSRIDDALVATAALLHSSAIARADITDADPALGQAAMLRMHKSIGGLLTVRADMLRVHESLLSDLQVVAGPDEPTCPKYDEVFTTATAA